MTVPPRLDRLRSVLFAPATGVEVLRSIGKRGADAIVIDCEDAVAPDAKQRAREAAAELTPELAAQGIVVTVRVNAPSSEHFVADINEALADGVAAVVVPKLERLAELDVVERLLTEAGRPDLGVLAGLETALGVADARELLGHSRVVAAYFGAEDFVADMGGRRTPGNAEVAYARAQVALAGRLSGVPVLDQVVADYSDDERFRREAADALALGYAGKLCIHPRQVGLANDAFQPSADELARAQRVVAAYEQAHAAGLGVIAFEGQMLDEPLAAQARRIIARSVG